MAQTTPESPPPPLKPPFSWRAETEEWVRTIVFGLLWYFCIITFVVEAYKIPSNSMLPTLFGSDDFAQGDRVLAIKALDQFGSLRRGDVIVFISVEKSSQLKRLVKRLVAFPGETVEIVETAPCQHKSGFDGRQDGKLAINGKVVTDPPIFLDLRYEPDRRLALGKTLTVPPGHYLVLGDNTHSSNDGRMWGPLPQENVLGRALFVWWKPGRLSSLNPNRQRLK